MKPTAFYEVFDNKMNVEFGTSSAREAVEWFRRGLDKTITVAMWDEEKDDFRLIQDRIDITRPVLEAIMSEKEKP